MATAANRGNGPRSPERAAHNILRAVDRNRAVAPIAAEAHLMYLLSRAVPPLGRWAAAKLADAAT